MKIKSKGILLIILACAVALYNFILFVSTSNVEKTPVFWISYAFIMLSIAVAALLVCIKNPFSDGTKFVLSVPVVRLSFAYFAVEFVIGTLFMLLQNVATVKAALLVQVPVLIIFVILTLVYYLGARHISVNYEKQKNDVLSQNMLYLQVSSLASSTSAPAVSEKLGIIADKIKFSDFNAYPELADEDQMIRATVIQMKTTNDEDALFKLAVQLERLVDERSEMCKFIKKKRG